MYVKLCRFGSWLRLFSFRKRTQKPVHPGASRSEKPSVKGGSAPSQAQRVSALTRVLTDLKRMLGPGVSCLNDPTVGGGATSPDISPR